MKTKRKGQGETAANPPPGPPTIKEPTKPMACETSKPLKTSLAAAFASRAPACSESNLELGTTVTVKKGAMLYLAKTGQAAKAALRHTELGAAAASFDALYIGTHDAKGTSHGAMKSSLGKRALLRCDDFSIIAVDFSSLTRTPASPAKE
jgi:hypothetical protein